jgi:NADH dehydrogenase (ubiquinone) 1 alpha subcomplex subunit 7
MADKFTPRNVSPLLQIIRNFLLGRKHTPEQAALRYAPWIAARTQPPPNLPDGEAHKLSANHYCLRDGRRDAKPPEVVADNTARKQITAGAGQPTAPEVKGKPVTPGKHWQWD